MQNTWRKMIQLEANSKDDCFPHILYGIEEHELDIEFDTGFGGEEGKPFLAYSDKFIYIPICYDGAEWVCSVPINVDVAKNFDWECQHYGGG